MVLSGAHAGTNTVLGYSSGAVGWEKGGIQLPDDTPFGMDLGLLIDVIRMANKVDGWEKLIPTYQKRMVDYIYLADYLGAQSVLDDLAGFLGLQAAKIDGSNPMGVVHRRVRSAYRMCTHTARKVRRGCFDRYAEATCGVCRVSLIPQPPNLPSTYRLPCCKAIIQAPFCYHSSQPLP